MKKIRTTCHKTQKEKKKFQCHVLHPTLNFEILHIDYRLIRHECKFDEFIYQFKKGTRSMAHEESTT